MANMSTNNEHTGIEKQLLGCQSCSELQLKLDNALSLYDILKGQLVEVRVNGERISYPVKALFQVSAVTSDIPGGGK